MPVLHLRSHWPARRLHIPPPTPAFGAAPHALAADLALTTMLEAMAGSDDHIFEVSRKIILEAIIGDLDVIRYRQGVLQDCLIQSAIVRELYAVAIEAREMQKAHYLGMTLGRYPDWVLRNAIESMRTYIVSLRKLRVIAGAHGDSFVSEGWRAFFAMLRRDLDDGYLALIDDHLRELTFRHGELLSAELGTANVPSQRRTGSVDDAVRHVRCCPGFLLKLM